MIDKTIEVYTSIHIIHNNYQYITVKGKQPMMLFQTSKRVKCVKCVP